MDCERIELDPAGQAYRLLNPGCVVLVTVGDGERDNVLSITWNMPLAKSPGKLALLCGKAHHSYPFIERTGELAINIPHAGIADAVLGCGSVSGRTVADKLTRFGLHREPARHIKPPLVAEAVARLECRVVDTVHLGRSALLLAEILRADADGRHFRGGAWQFDEGLQLIHHLGGKRFGVCERALTATVTKA